MNWIWDIFWFIVMLVAVDNIFLDGKFTDAIASRIRRKKDD